MFGFFEDISKSSVPSFSSLNVWLLNGNRYHINDHDGWWVLGSIWEEKGFQPPLFLCAYKEERSNGLLLWVQGVTFLEIKCHSVLIWMNSNNGCSIWFGCVQHNNLEKNTEVQHFWEGSFSFYAPKIGHKL